MTVLTKRQEKVGGSRNDAVNYLIEQYPKLNKDVETRDLEIKRLKAEIQSLNQELSTAQAALENIKNACSTLKIFFFS